MLLIFFLPPGDKGTKTKSKSGIEASNKKIKNQIPW